jgi:hypothetical protein
LNEYDYSFEAFGSKFKHGLPEEEKTARLGIREVLKPNALQPFGFRGSQVT